MKKVTILLPAYNEEAFFDLIKQRMEQVVEENPDFKYLSPKLEVFYLFMYDTYGTKNVNYLLNIKK